LAELGLEEESENTELLRHAARAAWLAGLLDDADGYARRWQQLAEAPADVVAALEVRLRLAAELGDVDAMNALSVELTSLVDGLQEDLTRARATAILAHAARMRDRDDEALEWADTTVALTDRLAGTPGATGVRLAALVEKGALLAGRANTIEQGRSLLTEVADRAEAAQEWLVAATALNKLVHLPPATSVREVAVLLERMRAVAIRAGSEKFAVNAYYRGRARLAMQKGNLAAATDAIERGRAHDLGYRRGATRADFHGAFLAGLRLEAGDLDGAAQVIEDLADVPGMEIGLPGLRFHVASRRGQVTTAQALLPDVIAVVQSTGGRDGEFLHDLVTAALSAPLSPDEVSKLIDGLEGPAIEPWFRSLVAGQLAEARGEHAAALEHYLAAAGSADLPPAPRGTAHVGAARVLLARQRVDDARPHAARAAELLSRWSGWRVRQLEAVQARLGMSGEPVESSLLTPREREVAELVAAGLTNAELAQRLYISPRTAAVHVSNILRKLSVSSRTDVAAALEHI
jgi:DNA-binding CsgD family transcriptional regulator/tetratricopeptide (TPR) repeat protein